MAPLLWLCVSVHMLRLSRYESTALFSKRVGGPKLVTPRPHDLTVPYWPSLPPEIELVVELSFVLTVLAEHIRFDFLHNEAIGGSSCIEEIPLDDPIKIPAAALCPGYRRVGEF